MKLTKWYIKSNKIPSGKCFAIISDLHGSDPKKAVEYLRELNPDMIFAPGDIFEVFDDRFIEKNEKGAILLSEAAKIAPVFYSIGNHEIGGTQSGLVKCGLKKQGSSKWNERGEKCVLECGCTSLNNTYSVFDGIAIGGLTSGILNDDCKPELSWLDEFCALALPKILLCHHPEYYEKYLAGRDIDLIVSGHAHGGQWRFFGRGVFAPGQGIFPKYTSGVYDGRLAVSRGLREAGSIPRIFNSTEVMAVIIK